jgi:hypothetical protein
MYTWKCHMEIPCITNLNKQKCQFFTKSENRRAEQVLSKGLLPVGGERRWGKGVLCTHIYKWKIRPVETSPGMGGEDKGVW